MRWCVLLLCAGCGRLAFDVVELTGDARGDAAVDGPPLSCTTAQFDVIPPEIIKTGGGTISLDSGRMQFTVPGTDQVEATATVASSSYAGRTSAIEVVDASPVFGAQTSIGWHQVTPGRLSVHVQMDGVSLKLTTFDEVSLAYEEFAVVPYDQAAHRWWRLREDGGAVFGEVSPDGVAWSLLGSLASFDTSDARWDFGLGVYNGNVAPTEATFDNFVDCVP